MGRRALVAFPMVSKQGVAVATFMSVVRELGSGKLAGCQILCYVDQTMTMARNQACRDAIRLGVDEILFVDSDMDFPSDVLSVLRACDADVACIDMWTRQAPSRRTVSRWVGGEMLPCQDSESVEDVSACGMACTLVRVPLIKMLAETRPDQWFVASDWDADYEFCLRAAEVGATIRCDFRRVSGHWGTMRFAGQPATREAQSGLTV